jgi:hypothetical protein
MLGSYQLFKLAMLMILDKFLDDIERHHEFKSTLGCSLTSLTGFKKLMDDLNVSENIQFLEFNCGLEETAKHVI